MNKVLKIDEEMNQVLSQVCDLALKSQGLQAMDLVQRIRLNIVDAEAPCEVVQPELV